MFKKQRRITAFLALALVLAMSTTTVFAQWPSFQNESDNNGIISVEPAITTPTVESQELLNNYGGGISSPSVIDDDGVAYTLYNGGYPDGSKGGARMQATSLSDNEEIWNKQIDSTASNVAQLSTPVIVGSDIYALTTGSTSLYESSDFDGTNWTGSASIASNKATFPAGGSNYIESVQEEVTFIAPTTNITTEFTLTPAVNDEAKYTIELLDGSNSVVATLVEDATIYGGYGQALNYYSGPEIPAGSYKMKLSITTDPTNPITVTDISLSGNGWKLYKVEQGDGSATLIESGVGATNTPITHYDGDLYFGIFGGDRSYYQYNISTQTLNKFEANDDFYWTGATVVGNYAIFGSDSGKVYWRDINNFSSSGSVVDLKDEQSDAGHVRSSIVAPGDGHIYFTSQGDISTTGNPGYLWKFTEGGTYVAGVQTERNTTSTPVISENGFIYVGNYDHGNLNNPEGGVEVVDKNDFTEDPKTVYDGEPVQASPVVYSVITGPPSNHIDYIYFTTNSATGQGYGYSYKPSSGGTGTATPLWTAGGTSANRFALNFRVYFRNVNFCDYFFC